MHNCCVRSTRLSLDLFSGCGGLSIGLPFKAVAYVEKDPAARAVLESRMRDGSMHAAPLFDDVVQVAQKMMPARTVWKHC